ncbi:Fe-S protein assembly co-chaperone HscB [Methylophilus medardicus]|uniref:Co-chaperone protein HscB homolog n=1 Tax=Methylophilus medardicus TaxID=2588534 RepID=A0A5B8CSX1_9PROT|nr:Fe-S protein assembly co-chaperone HscB [Methylophilus medardicus]QDC44414.1 Fe-S protein assembly co-chaperone HscB [Methylophilus medardicus]QDC49421.1 Fe-S protein assembly co-chaperone HscB [Methylophilus medardicus]QDC53126.1 Fe-S protein assembly co-chaperone HscB [Methylophilus medardicus]
MQNYFALFQLPQQFAVDLALLDRQYRQLQAEVHPDKFVNASPAERMQSMQMATLANEAYLTLKQPTARARYLLQLQGVETDEENNTAMPTDFLMAQMEWREAMDEAKLSKDVAALELLLTDMRQQAKALQQDIESEIVENPTQAALTVRKLRFIDKVSEDVNQLIAQLED